MSSIFTAPKFLSMPAVGLDISADTVRFIEFEPSTKEGLVVSRFASKSEPGLKVNGRVVDKKRVKETLTALAREHKLSFVNVSLPEEQGYLAHMRIPYVSTKEVRGAIELHLEEYVPIPLSDAIFDYTIIGGEHAARKRGELDLVISVLPRSVVDEYLDILKDTGLRIKSFEFESQAMARAIVPKADNGTFLVVDIGKTATCVFVAAKGIVQFSALLDIGGHTLTQALVAAAGVTYDEAEALKIKFGLLGGEKEAPLRSAMLPVVADLRARLLRHYSYWQTHHNEKAGGNIECIYLTGGGANLRGIEECLATGIDVKVVVANPWVNISSFDAYVPPVPSRDSQGFAVAIGLALRNPFLQ